jgi:TM1410 hypothetical-related protein
MKRKAALAITFSLIFALSAAIGFGGCARETEDIFSRPVVEKKEGEKKDWNDVSSFICYYGDFDEEQKNFDVAILHSNTLYSTPDAKEKVKELSDNGTYTIAYITVGEDDSLNVADGLGEGGYASYYIYENGFPKINPNWGSYFVDASNPVWQARILAEAGRILDYGVDGLFLDTLDTVDVRPESLGGLVQLVKRLHETYPEAKLVANRGFNLLKYISPYISGLMFESFNTTYDFTSEKVVDLDEAAIEYNTYTACNVINAVRRYDYFPVFCLDYCNEYEFDYMPQEYYNNSWRYDFIPYCTYDINLATPCNPSVVPTSKRGELALSKFGEDGFDDSNADTSANNLAYKENGATVSVDSTYPGYSIDALNDGWFATPENHNQNNWAKESWASMDVATDHWVEFTFTEAKKVSSVVVHWANDNGTYYSPQKAVVQAWIDGEWKDIAVYTNEPETEGDDYKAFLETTEFSFEAVTTERIRVLQPKEMGCADKYGDAVRKNIMWVSEIEIFG